MDELLISNIVESLFSESVKKEYLNMYLNDLELRKQCDEMILQMLEEDFSNSILMVKKV